MLCSKFKEVYRQYGDERYPFNCDFYIPEIDLFIEFNGVFTHGKEPFDSSNPEHLKILEKWKIKAKSSRYYQQAIHTWTVRDPLKAQYLKKLNSWSIYNIKEFEEI